MADARLLFGDCREQLRCIDSDSLDLIVTSPPYANQRVSTYGGIKPDDPIAGRCFALRVQTEQKHRRSN